MMNYIYGREAFATEKVVPSSDVEAELLRREENLKRVIEQHDAEMAAITAELDKRITLDREFPVVMRVKGVVDRVKELEKFADELAERLITRV